MYFIWKCVVPSVNWMFNRMKNNETRHYQSVIKHNISIRLGIFTYDDHAYLAPFCSQSNNYY